MMDYYHLSELLLALFEVSPISALIIIAVNWSDFGPFFYCLKSRELIIILINVSSECSHIDKEN